MATRIWRGVAPDVSEIKTYTFGGTFATSDTVTMTVNDQDVVLTVGTTATTAAVATQVYNALAGQSLGAGYSLNTQNNPDEFAGSEFDDSGAGVVTITSTPGVALGVTMATSGTGTITPATTQSATGKRWADNADNWSGSTAPGAGDTASFQEIDTDCSFGLSQLAANTGFERKASYSGRIGLPQKNDETGVFYESASQFVAFTSASPAITIGEGTGLQGAGMTRLDFASATGTPTITIKKTGSRKEPDIPPVDIKNLTSGTVTIEGGEVWLTDCTTCTISVLGDATIYLTGSITALTVEAGSITSEGAITTLTQSGGTVLAESTIGTHNGTGGKTTAEGNVTTATLEKCVVQYEGTVGTLTCTGSTVTAEGAVTTANVTNSMVRFEAAATTVTFQGGTATFTGSGAVGTLTATGGKLYYNSSGTLTTLSLDNDAVADFRLDTAAKTITNPVVMKGTKCMLHDPHRVIGSLVVDQYGAKPAQVDRGAYNRLTYGSPA